MATKRSILETLARVPLSMLKQNKKVTRPKFIEKIKLSLGMHGQIRPIYVDAENNIIEGGYVYLAMIELGYQDCFVVTVEGSVKERIQLFNNLLWNQPDFALVGRLLKDRKHIIDELPLSSQDVVDYIDFSDFNPDDYKNVESQLDLFDLGGEDG